MLEGLRVIGHTASATGLPLITAMSTTPAELLALRRAVTTASVDPALAGVRDALLIDGFEVVEASAWNDIEEMRRTAAAIGCIEL